MGNKDPLKIFYRHEDIVAKEIIIMDTMEAMDMEVAPVIMVDTVAKDLVGGPVADLEVTVAAEEATEVDTVADMEEDTIKDMIMEVAMTRATTKDTIRDMTRVMIIMVEVVAEAGIAAMNWQKMSNH